MSRRRWLTTALCAGTVVVACSSDDDVPKDACRRIVWHKPATAAAYVELVGDFNGWRRPGIAMEPAGNEGYRAAEVFLTPGEHTYGIVEDGQWLLDPSVGTSSYHDGREVTLVEVADCRLPSLKVESSVMNGPDGELRIAVTPAEGGAPIDEGSIEVVAGNAALSVATSFDGASISVIVRGAPKGKSSFVVRAKDADGRAASPVHATLWNEALPFDPHDALVYQVMLDRYRGDRGALQPPSSLAGRAGGTLEGLRRSIEAGEVEALGANVLWLSPVYRNPEGEFPGEPGKVYTGYHGYWPVAPRELDPRLGSDEDLRRLIDTAHARGIRVLFDVVPNHVHAEHPYATGRAGWINGAPGECNCGAPNCDWGAHMLDCWFAPYLPDLNWTNDALARQQAEDIAYWVETYGADGVRIDAVPMVPRSGSRRIAQALRSRFEHPGNKVWIVGENFTGPGAFDLLLPELGPFGLDTEFLFPLMWTMRNVIAEGRGSMADIDADIAKSEETFAGSGAVMGLMIGNHDVKRFASVSAGDPSGDGWTVAPTSDDAEVYAKQLLALGLVETLPGAPFLYNGDEIGLPGRGDPDTRRIMPATDSVSAQARELRAAVGRIGRARQCSRALRRGRYKKIHADRDSLVFSRAVEGETAFVVAIRNKTENSLTIPMPGVPAGAYREVVTGASVTVDPALTSLPSASFSVGVYLTPTAKCLSP